MTRAWAWTFIVLALIAFWSLVAVCVNQVFEVSQ